MRPRATGIAASTLILVVTASASLARAAPTAADPDPGYPCDPPDACHERVERYRALGLPEARLQAFVDSKRSLTAWYNREHLGGHRLKQAGWIFLGIGLTSMALGATLLVTLPCWSKREYDDYANDMRAGRLGIVAFLGLIFGGLETLIGIPLLIAGAVRQARWVEGNALDRLPFNELERRRLPSKGTHVSVLPYVTPGGGGVSLSLRF